MLALCPRIRISDVTTLPLHGFGCMIDAIDNIFTDTLRCRLAGIHCQTWQVCLFGSLYPNLILSIHWSNEWSFLL